jgi:hypothetical protein
VKPLSDFLTRIQAHVINCPEPTIAQATLDTCIEFAEESLAMREALEPFYTELAVSDYTVAVPSQTRVGLFKKIWIDNMEGTLLPTEMAGLRQSDPARPHTAYTRKSNGQFLLTFTAPPDGVYEVRLEAALVPTRTASQVDDDYLELWVDGIVAGAVSRLKMMPGTPWTDPAMADTHRAKFLTEMGKAERRANFGRIAGSLKVTQRPLAGKHRK